MTQRYQLVPALATDLAWIANQQAGLYSAADAIPEAVLRGWFEANPHCLFVIRDAQQARVGHLDLLPVREAALVRLIAGTLRERDLPAEALHPPGEKTCIRSLWVESLALPLPQPLQRARALVQVLEQLPVHIPALAEPSWLQFLYALAATQAGDNLIARMGFQKIATAAARPDAHDLFRVPYEKFVAHGRKLANRVVLRSNIG